MSTNYLTQKRRYIPESVIADILTQILKFCLPALVKIKEANTDGDNPSQSSGFLLHIPQGFNNWPVDESFALIGCHHSMERVNSNNRVSINDYSITFQRSSTNNMNWAAAITGEEPEESLPAQSEPTIRLHPDMFRDIWTDSNIDVALLMLDYRTVGQWMHSYGVRFLEPGCPVRGDQVIALQHPEGRQAEVSVGEVVEVFENVTIEHNAKTDSGSSGAPMMNLQRAVIGMHQGRDPLCDGKADPYTRGKKHGISIYAVLDAFFAQKQGQKIRVGVILIIYLI